MNSSLVLGAIKKLITTSPTAGGEGGVATIGLAQCLQANLRSYQELMESDSKYHLLRSKVLHYKESHWLATNICGNADHSPMMHMAATVQSVYLQFIPEALSLLLVLDGILCSLHEEDRSPVQTAAASSRTAPQAPKSLLSISDQKTVQSLIQFIVSLGVFPFLISPLDALLRMRIGHAKLVEKCDKKPSSAERATHLYRVCRVLVQCFENPVLGPNLVSQHLSDVLVALLQICYGDNTSVKIESSCATKLEVKSTPGGVQVKEEENVEMSVESRGTLFGTLEREWCLEALQKLVSKTYQPLVVRELLAIQKISSMSGSAKWLQRVCGQLLSERLMHKNGVQHVLRGIFEATMTGKSAEESSGDWKKCQAVAKIISSCPAGVSTVEDYYSLICPQILALFRLPSEGIGRQFLRVAVATVSAMMSKQKKLGMTYLFRPLIRPLLQLAGEEAVKAEGDFDKLCDSLRLCVEDLYRICTVVEPSSIFLNATLPYLPLIFDLWRTSKQSNSDFSSRCREVLVRILKPSPSSAVVDVLQFISGMKEVNEDCNRLSLRELHHGYALTCDNSSGFNIVVTAQSDLEALQSLDTNRMESIGNCLLDLVRCDFKSGPVPGLLFVKCLNHLSSQLCKITGYTCAVAPASNLTNSTETGRTSSSQIASSTVPLESEKLDHRSLSTTEASRTSAQHTSKLSSSTEMDKSCITRPARSSSLLLECEELNRGLSHTQAYRTMLVLYVTAALCEHMTDNVLQSISDVSLLLQTISTVVSCHAHFVSLEKASGVGVDRSSRGSGGQAFLLTTGGPVADLEVLPGGSITLSIVFGLLSAILGGDRKIERKDRSLLNSLLPPLETISTHYPEPELTTLANDLRICIATLGAVWSEEMKEKAAGMKSEGTFTTKVKSTAKRSRKGHSSEQVGNVSTVMMKKSSEFRKSDEESQNKSDLMEQRTCQMHVKTLSQERDDDGQVLPNSEVGEKNSFQQVLVDLADPLVPVQGHGLISLTRLIEAKDPVTLSNTDQVLALLQKHINHPDTYIYLSAINGLVTLASSCSLQRDKVVATLCQEYALLSGPPQREAASRVDRETGQLMKDITTDATAIAGGVIGDGGATATRSGSKRIVQRQSSELRIKLGEALVRIARESNELLPRYMEQIMASVLSNVHDPDPLIRASSLSNLADVSSLARFSLAPFQSEVLSCVRHILKTDREVKVRQAALTVLKLLIKGLSQDAVQMLGDSLLEVYRLLKQVESSEGEELTRAHAQAALGELDSVMRKFLFPEPNLRPQKKITILNN